MSDILIYENDDLMCALLQEWLREAGYRVHADASREDPADLVIVPKVREAGRQLAAEAASDAKAAIGDHANVEVVAHVIGACASNGQLVESC